MRRGLVTSAVLVAMLSIAGVAYADLTVVVHVNGGAEGVVVRMTDRNGAAHDCTTDVHGECTMPNVAPGTVFVEATSGAANYGRHVLIPDDGKVSIIVPNPASASPVPPSEERPPTVEVLPDTPPTAPSPE